jgi:hypothetical protein
MGTKDKSSSSSKEKSSSSSSKDKSGGASTSNNVYVMDKEFAWMPARLVSQDGDKAIVSIPTYADEPSILSDSGKGAKSWREETISLKHYPGKALPLQNLSKNGDLNKKDDMVDLPFLHEVRVKSFVVVSVVTLTFLVCFFFCLNLFAVSLLFSLLFSFSLSLSPYSSPR